MTLLPSLAVLFTTVSLSQQPAPLPGLVYTVDNAHSILDFTVRLVGFNRVRGSFPQYSADIYYVESDPTRSSVSFAAKVASVQTGNEERDEDLLTPAFFDQARFPYITFHSERVERTPEGFAVIGPLTIRDSTHQVRIPFRISGPPETDPFGNQRVVFSAVLGLDRKEYGVRGPRFWEKAISDSVHIEMELAGRVWNWSALGFRNRGRRSAGEMLWLAADSGRLQQAVEQVRAVWKGTATDTAYSFHPWGFIVAGMRQVSAGRLPEALTIVQTAESLLGDSLPAPQHSSLLAILGEVNLRAGRRADAESALRRAAQLDPVNTYALEWLRHLPH